MRDQFKIKAYTLIEVIIALFIFAILSGITITALRSIIELSATYSRQNLQLAQIQKAFAMIERDSEQIINRPILTSIGRSEAALTTSYDRTNNLALQFTRTGYSNPQSLQKRSTLQRVGYIFSENNLIRENWPVLDRIKDDNPQQRVLLKNVENVTWRFLDENNNFHKIWPPTEQLRDTLPRAIEVSLDLKDWGMIKRLFIVPENVIIIK